MMNCVSESVLEEVGQLVKERVHVKLNNPENLPTCLVTWDETCIFSKCDASVQILVISCDYGIGLLVDLLTSSPFL